MNKYHSPFWTIVRKEVADHVRSWRFLILIGIIALTCMFVSFSQAVHGQRRNFTFFHGFRQFSRSAVRNRFRLRRHQFGAE